MAGPTPRSIAAPDRKNVVVLAANPQIDGPTPDRRGTNLSQR
jgi:hypothetical protein